MVALKSCCLCGNNWLAVVRCGVCGHNFCKACRKKYYQRGLDALKEWFLDEPPKFCKCKNKENE